MKIGMHMLFLPWALFWVATAATPAICADYSPYVDRDFPSALLWGDTHLHTRLSVDAGLLGNRLGPDEAYRFARGEKVISSSGIPARLSRPLDFLAVADHSDGMGLFDQIGEGAPRIVEEEMGRRWHELLGRGENQRVVTEFRVAFGSNTLPWQTNDRALLLPVWQTIVDAAERYNDPGVFSTLIGYEWSSAPGGRTLHRVVLYRDGAEKVRDQVPYTRADSDDPEDLWRQFAAYEANTGGAVLSIPHNGNQSNGWMFADRTLAGEPLDADYAARRSRWEPLYEVTQIKGDSETHPLLSPDDEFADFETWDAGNGTLTRAKTPDMLAGEYARSVLKRGLAYRAELGTNPFKFGLVGSTDSHTSLATAQEDNFFGKHPGAEPSAKRATGKFDAVEDRVVYNWQQASAGLAAVWARENSREAIWDALKRREVYATTGSRMSVRFFAGWDFTEEDLAAPDLAARGYAAGVPMGADMLPGGDGQAPVLLVAAMRDPMGANLDRVQIIKGWRDGAGDLRERVYDVAWSDSGSRQPDRAGKLPAVGNTVDAASASWGNTIGSPQLVALWRDPDFEPAEEAFYYARVLEIPTPRWTSYDAARFGTILPAGVPATIQERAYTSPIWYTPAKSGALSPHQSRPAIEQGRPLSGDWDADNALYANNRTTLSREIER